MKTFRVTIKLFFLCAHRGTASVWALFHISGLDWFIYLLSLECFIFCLWCVHHSLDFSPSLSFFLFWKFSVYSANWFPVSPWDHSRINLIWLAAVSISGCCLGVHVGLGRTRHVVDLLSEVIMVVSTHFTLPLPLQSQGTIKQACLPLSTHPSLGTTCTLRYVSQEALWVASPWWDVSKVQQCNTDTNVL